MFGKLFGSSRIGDILMFLLINSKGYPSQIAQSLMNPLTPIQKALSKLEKEDIVLSYYQGKNRLYELNQSYPLFGELEALIRRGFCLLPSTEKKKFISHTPTKQSSESPQSTLSKIWTRLQSIKTVQYLAQDRQGIGRVTRTMEGPYSLIFEEEGDLKDNNGFSFNFKNTFLWTVNPNRAILTLEHLRYGKEHPIFLFNLIPTGNHFLESIDAHMHGEELYYGYLENKRPSLKLCCRTLSPNKNEEINYLYSS